MEQNLSGGAIHMDQFETLGNLVLSRKEVFDKLRNFVKVTEREISYWTDLEIVIPDIANPRSQGKTRFYSAWNVIDFAVVKRLCEAGLKLEFVKKVMDFLRSDKNLRFAFYFDPYLYQLLIIDQNTDRMQIKTDIKPVSEAFMTVWRAEKSEEEIFAARNQIPTIISESFETLFVFNPGPLVKKLKDSLA
jgi:hypothetical protein